MTSVQKFLATLAEVTDETIRTDLFHIEAVETGGSIITPKQSGWISTHAYEIHLHDTYMTGHTMAEAMTKWERCVRRCQLDDDRSAIEKAAIKQKAEREQEWSHALETKFSATPTDSKAAL